jgi:molybdopterin converting factor small subunit
VPIETSAILVRFFAGAAAAAGQTEEKLDLPIETTVAELIGELSTRGDKLSRVLAACGYLLDGVAVRDRSVRIAPATTLDVLPPFAGG